MTHELWLPADYWDLSTAVYLFLAVVAGGAYLTGASAMALRHRRGADASGLESELARWGFLVAVVMGSGAGIAVLSHLAAPIRGMLFPIYLTNFESWITKGTWILVTLSNVAVISLLFCLFGEDAAIDDGASLFPRRVLEPVGFGLLESLDRVVDRVRPPVAVLGAIYALGSVAALGTIYTGFELAVVETVPLWNEPVIVPLSFLTSGVAAGIALTLALTVGFEHRLDPTLGGYAVVVGGLSGVSLAVTGYGWRQLATTDSPAAAASYVALTEGTLAVGVALVVIGFVAATLVPLAVGVATLADRRPANVERIGGPALIGSFVLLLVGGLAFRVVILLAAAENPVVVV